MFVLANAMLGLAYILNSLIFIAQILVIARVIVSWVSADPRNKLVEFIVASTEPLLYPIRRRLPLIGGGLDLSPLLFLFGLVFLQYVLVYSMMDYAHYIKATSAIPVSGV